LGDQNLKMSRVRFKRRLYSLLEINGGEDLIPVFEEHIKKITGTIDNNFEEKFKKMLMKEFKFSKKESIRFLHGVYDVENYRHKLKSGLPKDMFKFVTRGGRPVQGGSPGLGKGKS